MRVWARRTRYDRLGVDELVTYDTQLATAASNAGLTVLTLA